MVTEVAQGLPPEIERYRQLFKSRLQWHTKFVHGYSMPWHQQVWCEALEDFSIKRLLIVAPPKYGKSPIVGLDYLGWRIGNDPEGYHCIYVSNTATQADKFSVALRDTIAYNTNYRFLYDLKPDPGKGWGENEWFVKRKDEADKDPTLQSTGVGGPVLGATVQEVVYDDIADKENMATEYQRKKLMDWIRTTPMSRLVPGGRAVMICTRWHENDPAAEFEKDGWVVIHVPAIDDNGQSTYPEFWTLDDLIGEHPSSAQRSLGTRDFEMMYQGRVLPAEGGIFKKEWWRYWKQGQAPWQYGIESSDYLPILGVVQSWDTAFKEKQQNDYSACTTWAVLANGYYLLDMWRGKVDFPKLKLASEALWRQWSPLAVLIEDAASGQCYSSDTEILTRRGWLRFPDVDINSDEFATRNMANGEFEWQKATARVDDYYSGSMVHVHSRPLDLLVTPKHRMLVTSLPRKLGGNCHRKGDVIVNAEDLIGYKPGSHISIPMISVWHGIEIRDKTFHADKAAMAARYGNRVDTLGRRISPREINPITMTGDEYCAFMGMYLSEGWHRIDFLNRTYGVFISQRKQNTEAFRKFQSLLNGIAGRQVRHDGRDFIFCSLGLAEHVAQFGRDAGDKCVPGEIMNASPRQLRIFWEYYMLGDGSGNGRDITTVSPYIAGQLVEIAQKIGCSASTYERKRPSHPVFIGGNKRATQPDSFRQSYKVSLRKSRALGFYADEVYYNGKIHCISVPNGVVYVRRNGKPAWCGQSLIQELRTNTRMPVIAIKVDRDKQSRAHAATPTIQAGNVFLPEDAAWRPQFEYEHEIFPGGANDDQVDTTTQFLNWVRTHTFTSSSQVSEVSRPSTWRQAG